MHGYAHNRLCQTQFHPRYLKGAGLKDFEGCERVFSGSNACARITRYSTRYHRHQRIDAHFHQWDLDRYESLGRFLFNNYRQALSIIDEHNSLLSSPENTGIVSDEICKKWLKEEAEYLTGLKKEPEECSLFVEYVEALQALESAE